MIEVSIRAAAIAIEGHLIGMTITLKSLVDINDPLDHHSSMPAAIRAKVARNISNAIYDLPYIHSGMISTTLCDPDGYRTQGIKHCLEHYYSRQRCGERIVELYEYHGLTLDKLIILLNKYRQVHRVTTEENGKLSTIQNANKTYHT